jgi:hypothetical protein
MGNTFRCAQKVIAWLGEDKNEKFARWRDSAVTGYSQERKSILELQELVPEHIKIASGSKKDVVFNAVIDSLTRPCFREYR